MKHRNLYQNLYEEGMSYCEMCPYTDGTTADYMTGRFPRAVYFEDCPTRTDDSGVIIIGQNPGTYHPYLGLPQFQGCSGKEQFTAADMQAFESFASLYHPYYVGLRKLIRLLGYSGPIWWTETVKCQGPATDDQAMSCATTHLSKELDVLPQDWPILVVGKSTNCSWLERWFDGSSDGVPRRDTWVATIHHPTGSQVEFYYLLNYLEEHVSNGGSLSAVVQWLTRHASEGTRLVPVLDYTQCKKILAEG